LGFEEHNNNLAKAIITNFALGSLSEFN